MTNPFAGQEIGPAQPGTTSKPFGGGNARTMREIRAPGTNKLLGYVDARGRQWTPDGKPTRGLPIATGYGAYLQQMTGENRDAANLALNIETHEEQQRRHQIEQGIDPDAPVTAGSLGQEQMWLDGQLVWVQKNPDGTWTSRPAGKPDDTGNPIAPPSAFDALDGNAIDPAAPFLMGYSQANNQRGDANHMPNPGVTSRNMLTVGGAASWLAELSTKDAGAYGAMLQKLHDAGYLSDADLAAAAGHWSSAAGTAMALAARDTAVVNTTAAGRFTTLDQFLTSKQGAYAAAQGAGQPAYEPIARRYTDPEDIKAAAKSEAEDVLGRQLTDEEEAQLLSHFRGLEDSAFDQIDSTQGKGTRYTPPGMGQVDTFVEDGHEQEAANFRAAEYGMVLKRLFGVATGG